MRFFQSIWDRVDEFLFNLYERDLTWNPFIIAMTTYKDLSGRLALAWYMLRLNRLLNKSKYF